MGTLSHYLERFAALPGWFTDDSAAIWDCLLAFQKQQCIKGHAFEVGVYHGKSAAMTCLHLRPEEQLVLVDPYRLDAVRAMLADLRSANVTCYACFSRQLPLPELLALVRVRHGLVERTLCEAKHLRGDADAALVQNLDGNFIAFAHAADYVVLWDFEVVEVEGTC